MAMSAIEEAGKLAVLRFLAHPQAQEIGVGPQDIHAATLSEFLRDHPKRQEQPPYRHPVSGTHRTSGLILLVRSGQWMNTRNACLYVDLQLRPPKVGFPGAAVSKALAFYMICMAYEVVAEQGDSAIENAEGWLDFERSSNLRPAVQLTEYGALELVEQIGNFLLAAYPLGVRND